MKDLKIEYGGLILWDGPVDEFHWEDSPNEVKVSGKVKGQAGKGIGDLLSGLGNGLAAAKKTQTAGEVVRRRQELT